MSKLIPYTKAEKDAEIERLKKVVSEYVGMDPVWAKTLDDLTDAKAEIKRLNSIIHAWSEAGCRYERRISHQKQLITELADALGWEHSDATGDMSFQPGCSTCVLLQQAREATKDANSTSK